MVQLSLENAQAGWVAAEQLGALKIQVPVLRKLPPCLKSGASFRSCLCCKL